MPESAEGTRGGSFGQDHALTPVDRLGVWLSARSLRKVGGFAGRDVADLGCGFSATFARTLLGDVRSLTLVDLSIDPELVAHDKVTAIEGAMPAALAEVPDASQDVVMCTSALEHLWEPEAALGHFHRMLRPGGVLAVNVPSWLGKRALETSAFRFGLSPAVEMNDHKAYYDPKDLWPLLVRAGFRPQDIKIRRHKLALNTFAVCRRHDTPSPEGPSA